MSERRKTKVQIGRRKSDIPMQVLEDFKNEMKDHVAETIKLTVNGKLDDLKRDTLTRVDFNKYVESDMEWKKENEPALANMKNITGLTKIAFTVIVGIGTLLTAIVGIRGFFSNH